MNLTCHLLFLLGFNPTRVFVHNDATLVICEARVLSLFLKRRMYAIHDTTIRMHLSFFLRCSS